MKLKTDFVTNSSSSSFILCVTEEQFLDLEESLDELGNHPDAQNEGVFMDVYRTKQQLDEYANDAPLDWASKPGGPRFVNMSQGRYELCLTIIEEGDIVVDASVDRNVVAIFEDKWNDLVVSSIYG